MTYNVFGGTLNAQSINS